MSARLPLLVNLGWLAALVIAAWFEANSWLLALIGLFVLEGVAELKLLRAQRDEQTTARTGVHVFGGGASGGASLRAFGLMSPGERVQ